MFSTDDTIAAVATPPGPGGLGVVRISGPHAEDLARRVLALDRPLVPRHATFTRVIDPSASRDASALDQVVATYFAAPHSYTGEDVVEISAHGSPVVLQAIVGAALRCGARLAEPGEFTLRAFLNGRMDLVQAEAVADLVDAVTPAQARAAFDQLEGTLTRAIAAIDRRLFDLIARLEASIDFPDEGYHFITTEEIGRELALIVDGLADLVRDGEAGRILREGRQVAIAGKPNVGKSTLFNQLLRTERAIVTPIAGTTRDLVSETVEIEGIRVCLVDSAGMRETTNTIEREGVLRARGAAAVADLVIVVLDRSRALEADDWAILQATKDRPRVVIVNKCDLPAAWALEELGSDAVAVSLKSSDGVEVIRKVLAATISERQPFRDIPAVTNVRHLALLNKALGALTTAREAVSREIGREPEEILLLDLKSAIEALEEVTGRRTTEDLLRHIFSRFCVGK
ncbi:MAG: tRNA uridine-5-carboxymethylaminomethyl(34) synthesis GTPase MnmE [Bacteroidales bacterium]